MQLPPVSCFYFHILYVSNMFTDNPDFMP
jgi:hypothetical protein